MHFDEKKIGDCRIYAGALEAPQGDGYIAAVIIRREGIGGSAPREIMRNESLASGHRWPSPDSALAYAIDKGTEAVRSQSATATAATDECDGAPKR